MSEELEIDQTDDEGLIPTDSVPGESDSPDPEDKLISQKEFDKIIQRRLKRQEEQFLKKYSDYEERVSESENFRKLQDEKSTDSQRWEKEREKLLSSLQDKDQELTKLQRSNLIADLASERGLPKSFWKRVQGETEEEIAEDMDSIVKDLGIAPGGDGKDKTPKAAPQKGTVYGGGGETEDPELDTDHIVSKIPRGPQIRVDRTRAYK